MVKKADPDINDVLAKLEHMGFSVRPFLPEGLYSVTERESGTQVDCTEGDLRGLVCGTCTFEQLLQDKALKQDLSQRDRERYNSDRDS